ncbi:MAG: putative DNA-binding domain-containing protein [Nitrospira sp.]|nr:putative DNA-binding domain-containing protein [Nitrospira sp.]
MPRLHELQRAFATAMIKGTSLPIGTSMQAGPSSRSLALYRRLIRNNYVQALTITYPMLRRVMGGRYFTVFARGYLKRYPSTSGDLFVYGRHFPLFLLQLESPRLFIELARLEWACHEVSQAAETPPFAPGQLAGLTSVDPADVTVHLQPTVRLLRFSSPVHRMWQGLQPDGLTSTEIGQSSAEEETHILVTRVDGKIRVAELAALDYRLLTAMADGRQVDKVERMALETDPQFDFTRFMVSLMEMNVLARVSVEPHR